MESVADRPDVASVPIFKDGFGVRTLALDGESSGRAERLTFSQELDESDFFAQELGDRVARLASARHASYARVRRVDRPAQGALLLISDYVPGWRLADLLRTVARDRLPVDVSATINLLRQLAPAVALFSRHQRDLAIGNIGPERLIVTPQGRLVITEHLLGSALESLQYSRERYWRSLRVATPPAPLGDATPAEENRRITSRADVCGIGVVALSLLLGRLLEQDEYPHRLPGLIDAAIEHRQGTERPLSDNLKTWLVRALQVEGYQAFVSPREVQVAFESLLATERGYVTSSSALEQWLMRHAESVASPEGDPWGLSGPTPASAPAPVAPSAIVATAVPAAPAPLTAPPSSTVPATAMDVRATGRAEGAAEAETTHPQGDVPLVSPISSPTGWSRVQLVLAAAVVVQALVIGLLWMRSPVAAGTGDGELVVQSRPASARITVDGEERGVTPMTLPLAPGAHVLEVRVGRSEPRVLPLIIQAGVQTNQYVELQSVPTTGGLEVRSDPPRARVLVRGQPRGSTPLVLKDLPPGDHDVVVQAAGGREVKQVVRIEPGVTSQLIVPLPK